MKTFLSLAVLVISFSTFADSRIEDAVRLSNCGGSVELRSHIDGNGEERFSLQFRGVERCSNVRLSSGKDYKLTDSNGNFQDKNFTLSNEAISAAKYGGLGVIIESNKGSTRDDVIVNVRRQAPAPLPQPIPEPRQPDVVIIDNSTGW